MTKMNKIDINEKIIKTKRQKEIVDITNVINQSLEIKEGLVHVFCKHTTCALTTADLDAGGTDQDYLDAFEAVMPKLKYRHPHNPPHVVDHILSSIVGHAILLPVKSGELDLGQWQRVVLIELDGPREREIIISFLSS